VLIRGGVVAAGILKREEVLKRVRLYERYIVLDRVIKDTRAN
jgi:hypothetical protein